MGGGQDTESTHFWAKHELNFVHVVHFSDACWAPCQVILQVCCAIVARMLLFVGFWLAGPKYVHGSYVGPTYLGIILQGPGPGLGACLFLCPPGVSAGGALAAQVWQGKGCFFTILGPKPVRWRACLFLCPAGISAGGWKRRHFIHRIVLPWIPMRKGNFIHGMEPVCNEMANLKWNGASLG